MVVDLTGDSEEDCGPSEPLSLAAQVLARFGNQLQPHQHATVRGLPDWTLEGLLDGVVGIAELNHALAYDLLGAALTAKEAASLALAYDLRDAALTAKEAASLALAQSLELENEAFLNEEKTAAACEQEVLHHAGAEAELGELVPLNSSVPLEFVQKWQVGGAVETAVTWRWEGGGDRAAWYADVVLHKKELKVAMISDMHGAHSMLDDYKHLAAYAEADVLVLAGDVFEWETAPSILDAQPGRERSLAKWLLAQPQRYKVMVGGNHDTGPLAQAELAALLGRKAPEAAASGRNWMVQYGRSAILVLQDEAAVIRTSTGAEFVLYAMPWHPGGPEKGVQGIYQFSENEWQRKGHSKGGVGRRSMGVGEAYKAEWQDGVASNAVAGKWGKGEMCDLLVTHGPPAGILDSIESYKAPYKGLGRPVGCPRLLKKLEEMPQRPAVVVFGHIHAEQGSAWLQWKTTKEAVAWRAEVKQWYASSPRGVFPALPVGLIRARRVVRGGDLSDVAAYRTLSATGELDRVQKALESMLFVNAASLNATMAHIQHGYREDRATGKAVLPPRTSPDVRLMALRPPVVVRLRKGSPAEVMALGVERFPEWGI